MYKCICIDVYWYICINIYIDVYIYIGTLISMWHIIAMVSFLNWPTREGE